MDQLRDSFTLSNFQDEIFSQAFIHNCWPQIPVSAIRAIIARNQVKNFTLTTINYAMIYYPAIKSYYMKFPKWSTLSQHKWS
jgi:hypothetical protein